MDKIEQVKQYTLGFLFRGDKVLLIQKNRPDWQKGKWNGVGGHIEHGETADYAMKREFKEEADATPNWEWFCSMVFNKAVVHCFRSFTVVDVKTMTDERLFWWEVNDLPKNVIPNLNWLIPMALQSEPEMLRVETHQVIVPYNIDVSQPDPPAVSKDLMLTGQEQYALTVLDMPLIAINQIPDQLNLHYDIGSAKSHQIALSALRKLKEHVAKIQPVIDGLRQENEYLRENVERAVRAGFILLPAVKE